VTFSTSDRLTGMNSHTTSRDRISLWIVLAAGVLMLAMAALSRGNEYPAAARRTDHFNGTGLTRLSVENVSGDIHVSAGPEFSAMADISVRAETSELARKYLDDTRVELRKEPNGEFSLVTEEPGVRVSRSGRGFRIDVNHHDTRYRIETRLTIVMPASAALDVHTVNGNVAVDGVGGPIDARSINGRVKLSGTRRDVIAHTVNGSIETSAAELPKGAHFEAETVNGNIQIQLPPRAAFDFRGHTMNGDILSTFPLPPLEAPAEAERVRAERERLRAEKDKLRREIRAREKEQRHAEKDGDADVDVDVDLSGLNEGLEELSRELSRLGPEIASAVSMSLNHTYTGSVGGGGAEVRCSTLNGRISILTEGVPSSQAKSLLPRRGHSMHAEMPEPPEAPEAPMAPAPAPMPTPSAVPVPPRPPHPPRPPRGGVAGGVTGGVKGGISGGVRGGIDEEGLPEGSIVRGDIDGDFSTTLPFGDVQVGKVAGNVRIVTYGGQIRVADAGKGADLSTSGGDIKIDGVRGDLRAVTNGGEVRVGRVTGDAKLETMGGDVDLTSCGGSVIAKTGGGDLRLHQVHGSVRASAGGGDVHCEIVGRDTPEGVTISSGSGDVTLVLPANFHASVDVQVNGVDDESDAIVSEFPEIAISRRPSSMQQTAKGALNGGGPRVAIRISSGTVRLKKGPAAP